MSSNAWRPMNTPMKHSQFSMSLFDEWRKEQNEVIAERGNDADPAVEEEHRSFMMRQNLNAYVCHDVLDLYTTCLESHGLIVQSSNGREINTKNRINEEKCRSTHNAYVKCMSSRQNQEMLFQSAALHAQCAKSRMSLLECYDANQKKELETSEPQCLSLYNRLMRCGLNHLWNDYWRALTKFGEAEEYHLYELSRDDNKKQEFLRVITSSEEQQREYLRRQREQERGYFIPHSNDKKVGDSVVDSSRH